MLIKIRLLSFKCPEYVCRKLHKSRELFTNKHGGISQNIWMCKWYCVAGMHGDNDGQYIKFGSQEQKATSNHHVAFEILTPSVRSCALSNEHRVILRCTRSLTSSAVLYPPSNSLTFLMSEKTQNAGWRRNKSSLESADVKACGPESERWKTSVQ